MHPYVFSAGGIQIASYGVMSALGYLCAAWYLHSRLKDTELKGELFWNLVFSIVVGALVGGKLFYLVLFWDTFGPDFFSRLVGAAKEFRFGFVFFGGLAGGLAGGTIYARRNNIGFWKYSDYFAPAIALGHGIGRIGCFLAGCCYGKPAAVFTAVKFTDAQCLVPQHLHGVPLHPVQLYEALGNFVLFAVLHMWSKSGRTSKHGIVMLGYICGYAVIRFIAEFFRGDDRGGFLLGLSPSQIIAVIACAATVFLSRYLPQRK